MDFYILNQHYFKKKLRPEVHPYLGSIRGILVDFPKNKKSLSI